MTKPLMSATLLSAVLLIGCGGGSSTETPQNPETPAAPAEATPPAAEPPPPVAATTPEAPARRQPAPRPAPSASRPPSAAPAASAATPAQPAAPPAAPKPVYRDVNAPVGTALSLSLITPISTETAQVETASEGSAATADRR